ncbi:MAG: Rid family hydrolase [Planctomycetaceae bacterium]
MHELTLRKNNATGRNEFVGGEHLCGGEVVTIETPQTHEIYMRYSPTTCRGWREDFRSQAEACYHCLLELIGRSSGLAEHILSERVFFENIARDLETFEAVRNEAYENAGVPVGLRPVTTYIQQPPARTMQKVAVQIHAVVPKAGEEVKVWTGFDRESGVTAKITEIAGVQHLFIPNIQGRSADGTWSRDFRTQCDQMWTHAERLLKQHGIKFTEVIRTWCYLVEMDRDYAEFNHSRDAFFATAGVKRLPASTGIEAGLSPVEALCSVDIYAILNPERTKISVMHTPTLNEAAEYGSRFSRGMRVDLPDKTVLYISGTASIDETGTTVHVGDVERQIDRMLVNIEQLLQAQGASFAHLVQASTYLKHAVDLELYERKLAAWGIRHLPNTLVEAGVCRPELLVEMEAIAVLSRNER